MPLDSATSILALPAVKRPPESARPVPVPARDKPRGKPAPSRRSAAYSLPGLPFLALVSRRSAVLFAVAGLWELLPRLGLIDNTFFPPFSEVLKALWDLTLNGQIGKNLFASLGRSGAGYLLAVTVAVPLGLFLAWYRGFAEIVNPLLESLRNTAPLALLPVFILFLGIGEVSKMAFVFYACSWPILLNTINGARQVDPLLIKSARTFGVTQSQLFLKVILPGSLPSIFVGMRLAGSVSVLVLIASEMIGATAGLGYFVQYSQFNFQIPQMYAGILVITAVGLAVNKGLSRLEHVFTAWKPDPSGN
jgi:NitT/TauT family transport system permease protein